MDRSRLLIAVPEPYFGQFVGEAAVRELQKSFGDIVRLDPAGLSLADWTARFRDVRPHALLSGWETPPVPVEAVPPLQMVAHCAGGVRELVGREMIERGLCVTNWGDTAAPAVAEHALLLTLASLRRLTATTLDLHCNQGWPRSQAAGGFSLFGRRVGIHGFGSVARNLVRLLRPFDCRITAYSEGVPAAIFAEFGVAQASSLEDLFDHADVLIEAEALTSRTRGSITAALLARLPDGATFVNVGRGATVDADALTAAAVSGRLQFALDVYDVEPLPAESPLRGLANVTLSPHVGGPTIDQRPACGRRAVENLCRFAAGEPLNGLITPDVYDRST